MPITEKEIKESNPRKDKSKVTRLKAELKKKEFLPRYNPKNKRKGRKR